jgi:hypothetical protein
LEEVLPDAEALVKLWRCASLQEFSQLQKEGISAHDFSFEIDFQVLPDRFIVHRSRGDVWLLANCSGKGRFDWTRGFACHSARDWL